MPVIKHANGKFGIGSGPAEYDDAKTAWRAYYGYLKDKFGSIEKAREAGELPAKKKKGK